MKPRRVLVVAGDAPTRRHLRDNLFVSGYSVFDAVDRRSTIAAVDDFSPDAVVIDLTGVPDQSGIELISAVREAAERRPVVVAIAGDAQGALPSEAREAGADDHLVRPFCIGELLVRVDRLLGVALPPPRNEIRPREWPRFADLVTGEDPITLVWVTLAGTEQLADVGISGHRWLAEKIEPVIAGQLKAARCWWAGTERIVAIGEQIPSAAELAAALQLEISAAVASLSLPIDIRPKVRAGVRRWGEGRPSFLARVTGRLSHGGLPASPLNEGPAVPLGAAAVRSAFDRQAARRELGRFRTE